MTLWNKLYILCFLYTLFLYLFHKNVPITHTAAMAWFPGQRFVLLLHKLVLKMLAVCAQSTLNTFSLTVSQRFFAVPVSKTNISREPASHLTTFRSLQCREQKHISLGVLNISAKNYDDIIKWAKVDESCLYRTYGECMALKLWEIWPPVCGGGSWQSN